MLAVSIPQPDPIILFGAFLFLFLFALFLEALGRLFLCTFLCNESFCHGSKFMINNNLLRLIFYLPGRG